MIKYKILLVNDFLVGGGTETVFNKQFELLFNHHIIEKFYAHETHKLLKNPISYIFSIHFFKIFFLKLQDFKPDIIHIHNYYHVISPSILYAIKKYRKNNLNLKVIYTAHDFHLLCPNSGFTYYEKKTNELKNFTSIPTIKEWIFKSLDYRGFIFSTLKKIQFYFNYSLLKLTNEIDVITAPSIFLSELLQKKFANKKVMLLRNPIDLFEYINTPPIITETLSIIYLGRLSHEKGLNIVLNYLVNTKINFSFKILGEGPDLDKILPYLSDQRIKYLGFQNQELVKKYLQESHVLILPSIWYENAPMVLLEALQANIRILATNHGGIKELAKLCGGSYLYEPNNEKSFLLSLNRCHDDVLNGRIILDRNKNMLKNIFSLDTYKLELYKCYNC